MPKRKETRKHDGAVTYRNLPSKLRVGSRGSGQSANTMSNEDLTAVLENSTHKKDHSIAKFGQY